MNAFRATLWVLVALLAGAAGYLAWQATRIGEPDAPPYGVAFSLVDQKGNAITEAAFRERPTALFFGFTHCPEVCPTTLFELDGWLKKVDPAGDRLDAYFVSVDPERDTPAILDSYVSNVSDRIIGITGSPEAIAAMVKGFNIYARKVPLDDSKPDGDYTMDHTASVFLLTDGGRFKSTIAYGENPDTAIEKLENLLKG